MFWIIYIVSMLIGLLGCYAILIYELNKEVRPNAGGLAFCFILSLIPYTNSVLACILLLAGIFGVVLVTIENHIIPKIEKRNK